VKFIAGVVALKLKSSYVSIGTQLATSVQYIYICMYIAMYTYIDEQYNRVFRTYYGVERTCVYAEASMQIYGFYSIRYSHRLVKVDVEHSFTNVNFVVQHKINCGGIRWIDIARIQSRIVVLHPGGYLYYTQTRANT
jgi:hypothetical protein